MVTPWIADFGKESTSFQSGQDCCVDAKLTPFSPETIEQQQISFNPIHQGWIGGEGGGELLEPKKKIFKALDCRETFYIDDFYILLNSSLILQKIEWKMLRTVKRG